MKKERIISLMLALFATATAVRAQALVQINSSTFPDANFRNIVKGKDIDKDQDGMLSTAERLAVTTLTVSSKSIESLKGVEHFFKLTQLNCDDNRLSSLDVSKITTLKTLYCSENRLTSLDVSKNTELTALYCYSNQIGHSDMLKLVNSLPTVTKGNFCGISISSSSEKNVLPKSCVEIAQGKGWSVKAKDGSSNVDYEGSDDPGIIINATNFPDTDFRVFVAESDIDKDADGYLSTEEIAAVTHLDVSENGIQNLKGIEFFTALTELYCENNQLTSLDVSKNTALKYLYCENNQLVSLNVSKNTALQYLCCDDNQLTSLDVSKNIELTRLYCPGNQLKSLDVSKNTALTDLYCEFNQLTSLDVSKNTALQYLYCYSNKLTSLDVSKNTALKSLWCYGNQLTSLDVSKNIELTRLYCFNNQIKGDKMQALVNSLPTVTEGHFYVIDTTSSNEQNVCTKDQVAIAKGKGWTVYDYNGGSRQEYAGSEPGIAINATNFPDENFRTVVAGTDIDKDADGYLSDEEIAAVTQLKVSNKNIASLKGIEFFTALKSLSCSFNQLTSLDVSKNTALNKLYCFYNQLTSLDVSKNTALTVLHCYGNKLTSLDVNKNTALTDLYCSYNQLTSLDVSKNSALIELDCDGNQLTSLDVSKNTALKVLDFSSNQLKSLDVSKNTALTELYCFNNQIKGDKMQALVNSLPTVTSGEFYVIDTKSSDEQNVCTEPQVKIATDKGWTVYDWNGGYYYEYEGSVVTAIRSIEVSPETKSHWYTLDGKRLSGKPTQKGIYVRNGRKVVVK